MIDPDDRRTWRPQAFGRRATRQVRDPIVEPLWSGIRVLAHVAGRSVEFLDIDGQPQQDWPATAESLAEALQADGAVLDGYLTTDAARDGVGVAAGPRPETPTPGFMARRLFLGGAGRDRHAEAIAEVEATREPRLFANDDVRFVAVDVLMLDDQVLLEVPLLERKRLLDAVLVEGPLVRRSVHVRPPVNVWLGTWRNIGFRAVAFKDVNSRYRPGMTNEDWATASIQRA
jgi:ATP-dependent DNA ligase